MKDHLREDWVHPEANWRAVDYDGELWYHRSKPILTCVDWASDDFVDHCIYGYDSSYWQNSLQSKADWKALTQEPPLQGIYEAKGVKFPAWVEVRVSYEWVRREGVCVDADGFLMCYTYSLEDVIRVPSFQWRPIAPTPRLSVDEMKRLARLTGGE